MQKSKKATITIICGILIYGILANFVMAKNINTLYVYVVNPLFWLTLATLLYLALGKSVENRKLRKPIIQYTVIAALIYIIVYMLSGLVVTFGNNPYNTTMRGLIINLWSFGVVLAAKELIRFKIIDNVYEKDKTEIAILISIVYVVIDIETSRIFGQQSISVIKYIVQSILPNVAKNMAFSYSARYSSYIPAIIYQITTNLYYWVSPILPNSPWVMTSIIDITIPTILFLYIRYVRNKLDIFRTKQNLMNSDPRNIIPLVIVIVLAIWFATGVFPIKPVAIASGSMEKELYVGDIAIIQKCGPNDVNVGDIIEYQMEGYTVIHRIQEKNQRDGEFYFITKGDNNAQPDVKEVNEDQLIGKVIFKIKYLGYPAIWLHIIQTQQQMDSGEVQVETGN